MTQIRERIEGHYEVEEVPYGRVYKWTVGHALVECENCGQLMIVDPAATACPDCGTDYAEVTRGLEGKPLGKDETYYPERKAYEEWLREEETHPHLKHYEWLELEALRV
jgi:hypothetical protein